MHKTCMIITIMLLSIMQIGTKIYHKLPCVIECGYVDSMPLTVNEDPYNKRRWATISRLAHQNSYISSRNRFINRRNCKFSQSYMRRGDYC